METLIEYCHRLAGYDWWEVAIELTLIGLVVYWIVDFLEGTRGERLFRGVIFILVTGLLVLNLFVEKLHFERLELLYKWFLVFVLIVAVAAFQPEIRRALIRIAQPRFLFGSSQKLSRTVEELIKAVIGMSASKTGAIIVIEQKVALGEFIETGVRIDAKVTAELLKSIFYPGTPLHDMAVIIREDRIIAARVQLPLAEVGRFENEEFGSRHRAAIGIAAGSDASVIVVSEETGSISFADNGKLIRNIDESQLRIFLTSIMEQQGERWFWKTQKVSPLSPNKEAEEVESKINPTQETASDRTAGKKQ